jgi:hypothetical protein
MATTKKPTVRKVLAPQPDDPAVKAANNASTVVKAADAVAEDGEAMVMVMVPRGFNLTIDNFTQIRYEPGPQTMPRKNAEHWYAKAHGVTIKN